MAKLLLTSYKKINTFSQLSVPKRVIINSKNIHKIEDSNSAINPILLQYDSSRLYPSVRYDQLLVDDVDKEINGVKSSLYQEVYNIEVNVTKINLKVFSPFKTMTINLEDIAYIVENDEGFAQLQNVEIVNEGHPVHQFIDTTLTFDQILSLIFKARPCVPCSDEEAPTESCCGELTAVTTIGEWRALANNDDYNYVVVAGIIEDFMVGLFWIEVDNELDSFNDEDSFSELIPGTQIAYHSRCSISLRSESQSIPTGSGCDCEYSIPAQTVGDLLESYEENKFNYFLIVLPDEGDGFLIIVYLEFTTQIKTYLKGLPSNTPIDDALDGTFVEEGQIVRVVSCTSDLFDGIVIPPQIEIDSLNASCDPETAEQVITVEVDHFALEPGTTIKVYALVNGISVQVSNTITIINDANDSKTITLNQEIDTGNNTIIVVADVPGDDNLVEQIETVIQECEPIIPDFVFSIDQVEETCDGLGEVGLSTLAITFTFEDIPAGTQMQLYARVNGVFVEVFSTLDFVGTFGATGVETLNAASALYDEQNNLRAVLTLGNTVIYDNNNTVFNFFNSCRNAPHSVTYKSNTIQCVGELQEILLTLSRINVELPCNIFIYSLVGGTEMVVAMMALGNPGSDPEFTFPAITGLDYGDNFLKIKTVFSDLTEFEETINITVPYCSSEPGLRIEELLIECEPPGNTRFDLTARWDMMPEVFSLELYSLVSGIETLLATITPIAAGSATYFMQHWNVVDAGANYLKIKVTLSDLTVIEDTQVINVTTCIPEVVFDSASMQCEFDLNPAGLNTTRAHLILTNIPIGTSVNVYVGFGANDNFIGTSIVTGSTLDIFQAALAPYYDTGATYIKLTIPSLGYSITHNLISTSCP